MDVLLQAWKIGKEIDREYDEYEFTISWNKEQLERATPCIEEGYGAEPYNAPVQINIPDDHALAAVVKTGTLFLYENGNDFEEMEYLH